MSSATEQIQQHFDQRQRDHHYRSELFVRHHLCNRDCDSIEQFDENASSAHSQISPGGKRVDDGTHSFSGRLLHDTAAWI
jgi:hypothetical protein